MVLHNVIHLFHVIIPKTSGKYQNDHLDVNKKIINIVN